MITKGYIKSEPLNISEATVGKQFMFYSHIDRVSEKDVEMLNSQGYILRAGHRLYPNELRTIYAQYQNGTESINNQVVSVFYKIRLDDQFWKDALKNKYVNNDVLVNLKIVRLTLTDARNNYTANHDVYAQIVIYVNEQAWDKIFSEWEQQKDTTQENLTNYLKSKYKSPEKL